VTYARFVLAFWALELGVWSFASIHFWRTLWRLGLPFGR
jgi:hypothetical protein